MMGIITISDAENHQSRKARMPKLAMRAPAARHRHEPAFAKSESSWRILRSINWIFYITRNRKPST
jgi:hypothetical protein